MIELGDKAKDTVTGYTGIAVARTEWINGCARITLMPDKLNKDGGLQQQETFDEPQLVLVKHGVVKRGAPDTGGPIPRPTQAATPR